jgi:LPXTG-site transpeptidase (sortase) family protein
MAGVDWDAGITRAMTVLLGICVVAVGIGFVLPSSAGTQATGYRPMSAPAMPVRLIVPALKIKAPIQPIEVDSQAVLDPPHNPRDVGWWQRSARPGAQQGQTVLTGHTVHTGGGVMDDLAKLRRGQLVKVVTPKGTMVYRTTRVVTWSKDELARNAVAIFAQKRSDLRLVLITCSGWTGSYYTSNVVAFAKPLGVREHKA